MRNTIGLTTLPRGRGGKFWALIGLTAAFLFVLSFLIGYVVVTNNNVKPAQRDGAWQVDYKSNPSALKAAQQQVAADSDAQKPEDIPEINWLYQVKHRFTEFWGESVNANSYTEADKKTQKQAKDMFMAAFAWKEDGKDWFNPLPVISFSEAYYRATERTISDTGNFLDLIQESTDGNWYVGEKGVALFVKIDEIIRDDKTVLTTGKLTGGEAAQYFNTGSSANGVVYANAGGISGSNLVIWRITHHDDKGGVEWTIYMLVRCGNFIVTDRPGGVKNGPTDNDTSPTVSVPAPSKRPQAQSQTPRSSNSVTTQTPKHPITTVTTQSGGSGGGGRGGGRQPIVVEAKKPEQDPSQTGNAGVGEGAGRNDDPGPGPAQVTPPPSPPPTYTSPKTVPSGDNSQSGTANGGSGSSGGSSQSGTANSGSSASSSSGGEGGNTAGSGSTSTTGNSSGTGGATITSGGDDGGF